MAFGAPSGASNDSFNDILIDFESLATTPNCTVVNLAIIPFRDDQFEQLPTFEGLVNSGKLIKFKLKGQGRHTSPETVKWWKALPPEARIQIVPTDQDVDLNTGLKQLYEFCESVKVDHYKSHNWCRGGSFDHAILNDLLRGYHGTEDIVPLHPIFFTRERDVRTAIEQNLNIRNAAECPLPLGMLPGFIHHNPLHDCAKDILMLLMSKRYSFGLDTPPEFEYTEPVTRPKIKINQ